MALGNVLLYIFRAQDEASKEVQKIKQNIDKLDDSFSGTGRSAKIFSGLLTREAGEAMRSFGTSILGTISSLAESGREAERTMKGIEQVLASTKGAAGLTAKEIQRIGDSLAMVTNFEDDTILAGERMLLTFTKIGKDVFPKATEAALNLATHLGTDVTSAAMQLGKALNDPAQGLAALTRSGVQFTEEQQTMIERMIETGDVAGAQRMILDELDKKFGGLARATSDAGTQLAKTWGEVKEALGTAILPVLNQLAQALLPIVQKIQQWVQDNPELAKTILIIVGAVGSMLAVLGTLIVVAGSVAAALAALGLTLAGGAALAGGIALVTGLIATMILHWDKVKETAQIALNGIVESVDWFAQTVGGAFQMFWEALKMIWATEIAIIQSAWTAFLDFTAQAVISPIEAIKTAFSTLLKWVSDQVEKLKKKAQEALSFVTGGLVGAPKQATPRATGGRVNEPFTWVGERGPELVSLPRGSFVHTAEESRRMTEGEGERQSFVLQGNLVGTVHVHNEADEDRLVAKISRAIRLQQLQAA